VSTGPAALDAKKNALPSNIARKGGISHNVLPIMNPPLPKNGNARLAFAPAVRLPPFAGIGKRSNLPASVGAPSVDTFSGIRMSSDSNNADETQAVADVSSNCNDVALGGPTELTTCPAVISGDFETSSSNSSRGKPQIRAYYHVNEDDMILMEDVIMCPFVFRTQDTVLCGAMAECIMPGMLRAHFSSTNKLLSMEMVYDAMGFMQQLERASGSELMAQIIPGSLEMALSPGSTECRVITLGEPPFRIVNVNEPWTRLTKYSQMEAEGMELFALLDASASDDQLSTNNPPANLDDVMAGQCKCTTRFHYDKDGREFVDFFSSYPLTNSNDEITHLLHVSKELAPSESISDENSFEGTNEENS
jgi:hypothetical protein